MDVSYKLEDAEFSLESDPLTFKAETNKLNVKQNDVEVVSFDMKISVKDSDYSYSIKSLDLKPPFTSLGLEAWLPDQGVQLAVFTDPFFDDKLAAFDTANKDRARAIWLIDWSDIDINVIKTRSVKRQTNVADNLYNCVIQPNVNHYSLNSKTFEMRVGDTNRHAMIENFSDACPTLTSTNCALA